MCSPTIIKFGMAHLSASIVQNKRIIEIGSQDVNGSVRPIVEFLKPKEYIGIDSGPGKGVDIVCKAEDSVNRFGTESFDVVICTELLEHVLDWRNVISNIKRLCAPKGTIIITTRSKGFHYHPYPYDFWRYEVEDMRIIFSDCIVEILEKDPEGGGVFIKAIKPDKFTENDLSKYELYRMPESL